MIRDAYSAAMHRERERERETTFCCIIKKTLGCLVYPGWSSFNQNIQTSMKVCVQGSIKWWHHDQPTTRCGSTMETRKQYVYNKNIGFVKPTLYIYSFFSWLFEAVVSSWASSLTHSQCVLNTTPVIGKPGGEALKRLWPRSPHGVSCDAMSWLEIYSMYKCI